MTDYDKLTLEVWTDGSVTPQDAVAYAAKIIKEQLTVFINFDETEEPVVAEAPKEEAKLNENLFRSVDELELSRPLAPTASSRRTSRPSATWSSAPRPRCSRPRTSAASR